MSIEPSSSKYVRQLLRDAVKAALSSKGHQEKEHQAHLQAALEISQSTCYRKLALEVGWSDADLAAVARYLRIDPREIFATAAGKQGADTYAMAKIDVLGKTIDCRAFTDGELKDGDFSEFVLVDTAAGKKVYTFDDAPKTLAKWRVKQVAFQSRQTEPPRVAILEDDESSLENACHLLQKKGLSVFGFQGIPELGRALDESEFDIVVLDWWVNKQTPEILIEKIRSDSRHKDCLLAVVTGELTAGGKADENSLEELIARYGIKTYTKPVRWLLLGAEWTNSKGRV